MSNTLYPGALDSFTNPTTTDTLASVSHVLQHGKANDALLAIETKVGYGASNQTPVLNGFLVGTAAGETEWVSSLTSPSITTSLEDLNGKTWISQSAATNAVNYLIVGNSATGNDVTLQFGGTDTNGSINIVPKGSGAVLDNGSSLIDFRSSFQNFVQSGGLWTAGVGLAASMTAATLWINGVEYGVSAVSSHTFGASVDTYIDYTAGTGLVYTAVTNNAASPTLSANSIRLAIVVTGASTISAVNQGQVTATLPTTTSSIPVAVCDTLGNIIYPKPRQKLLGFRQYPISGNSGSVTTTSTTATAISAGLNIIVKSSNLPNYTNIRACLSARSFNTNNVSGVTDVTISVGSATGSYIANGSSASFTGFVPLDISGLYSITADTTFVPAYLTNNASYTAEIQTYNIGIIHTVELE